MVTRDWRSLRKYDESIDFVACVRADIWRRPGWDGRSAVVVGTPLALGLQGRRKADLGPDCAIFLVLELDDPFTGLMGISSSILRSALLPLNS